MRRLGPAARYTAAVSRPSSNRGIAPELLLSQIRNTAPYVFGDEPDAASIVASVVATPPAAFVRALEPEALGALSHADYFRLCLSAHYLTCATLVPTDVDNQIRQKLWTRSLPLATVLEMGRLVLESGGWDFGPLTTRACYGAKGSPFEEVALTGHAGEFFTVAAGAYAALGRHKAADARALRDALLEAIAQATERCSEVFGSLVRAGDGIGALRAAATIAHNFGDLDRVIDMWDLPFDDPLRLGFRGLTGSAFDDERRLRYQGRLWTAGELYKSVIEGSSMALENHRHFALRKPRGLRTHPALRVPLGPFFDDWGAEVAARLEDEPLIAEIDALVQAALRKPKTASYARALCVIRQARPELDERSRAIVRHPQLGRVLAMAREDFEARWSSAALAHLDAIPARARP